MGRRVLKAAGAVGHEEMALIAEQRYKAFDQNRCAVEALEADAGDLREIEQLENTLKKKKPQP